MSKLFIAIAFVMSGVVVAQPDVSFSDSPNYNDAYLRHELQNGRIRFILTGPIEDFRLPTAFFAIEPLKYYIAYRHIFPSEQLKQEFIAMLESSFYSQFDAPTFLQELIAVLRGYSGQRLHHVRPRARL